jgi:uncharacterized membrane protein YraQ (UPF0718 family)
MSKKKVNKSIKSKVCCSRNKKKITKKHNCKLVNCNTPHITEAQHVCCSHKHKKDWVLYISVSIVAFSYLFYLFAGSVGPVLQTTFTHTIFETLNKMWIGIGAGIFFAGLLSKVPQDFVVSAFGSRKAGFLGIAKASVAGVLLDLCSHGILIVAMQLYKRGLSLGQVIAFLVASPWNSVSLTFILWSLIGLKWTLIFILGSVVVAIVSGLIFEKLVEKKKLPDNPNRLNLDKDFKFWEESIHHLKEFRSSFGFWKSAFANGISDSKMVLKWIFIGVIIAACVRTFMPLESFKVLFGPTLAGLGLTIIAATAIEVCSEGSIPIAAEILTRAKAPGNSFAFLMVGVSTDYTEIMSLKETTKSWKIALFLPLITLPQVVLISMMM